ncbi:MAG: hypothetical protein HY901_01865, partial [Deltaproteobacteria bacterium]|nr:hypothetical protein [Deltaproteobacteria bacterium]
MTDRAKMEKAVQAYRALVAVRAERPLSKDEEARFELLRDLVTEAQAGHESMGSIRPAGADICIELALASKADL